MNNRMPPGEEDNVTCVKLNLVIIVILETDDDPETVKSDITLGLEESFRNGCFAAALP